MKKRKGFKFLKFADGDEAVIPIDDVEPMGVDHVYSKWIGEDSYTRTVKQNAPYPSVTNTVWLKDQNDLAELAASKGRKAADEKRTQKAEEFWKHWRVKYKLFRDNGMNIEAARIEVGTMIAAVGDWNNGKGGRPSERTLIRWLRD